MSKGQRRSWPYRCNPSKAKKVMKQQTNVARRAAERKASYDAKFQEDPDLAATDIISQNKECEDPWGYD